MGFSNPHPVFPNPVPIPSYPNPYIWFPQSLIQATGFPNPQSLFPQSLTSYLILICFSMFPNLKLEVPLPQSLTWVHHYPIPNPGFPNLIFFFLLPQSSTYMRPKPQYGFFQSPISHEIIRNRHIECCNWQESCMFALFARKFWREIPGFIHISPGTI